MDPPHPPVNANHHPDSSSPRDSTSPWVDADTQVGTKLRLMCSYGGHIIPRPHDKSLCYVGGDTRIVVVDRQSTLSDIHSRLGQTLLNGRRFTLKYQLPNEDLDNLISIATDEDLDNMLEEYDRSGSSPLRPSRLRLFLFPSKPETAASMGSLLDDAKSETWFVDALNGSGLLPRGLSDSAVIDNNLLELEESIVMRNKSNDVDPSNNVEDSSTSSKQVVVMEMNSSFGSSSSSPCMANLPQIKVRVEEQEQVGTPPLDGKLRKPPLPLLPVQRKFVDIHNLPSPDSKQAIYNLPSPDSVASDSSIASVGSLSKQSAYQENRLATPIDPKMITQEHNTHAPPMQHQQQMTIDHSEPTQQQQQITTDHSVPMQQQQQITTDHSVPMQQQPQYIQVQQHTNLNPNQNTHYIPSYYHPMYQTHQSPFQPQTDPQHYAMYLMDAATGCPVLTQHPPNPMVQQIYQPNPEIASTMPSPSPTPAPLMYQYQQQQQQQQQHQYMGVSKIPPHQAHGTAHANYGYDQYSQQAMQDQMYYGQTTTNVTVPPTQYQTITPAAAAAIMSQAQASTQLSADTTT